MIQASSNDSTLAIGLLDRIFARIIPARFLTIEHAFHSKMLWLYSASVGGLAVIILIALYFTEDNVPMRRLGTLFLASLLFAVPILMRHLNTLKPVAIYVVVVSMALIFYIDFNNQSIQGPSGVLWLVPIMLITILFSGWRIVFNIGFCSVLFLMNVYFLKQGWLPVSIVNSENFHTVQVVYICAVSIILILSTHGISKLSQNHFESLQQEIQNKQNTIDQISALKREAEASGRSKSIFLATMSHELRTPLNSVIGNAQILSRAHLPNKHHEQVNDISIAGNLLLMLINDILDFSKLEEDEIDIIEEPYDLTEQIIELSRMMKARLKKSVLLDVLLPKDKIYINADQNRIAQVLMNLISNAMKFTDKGFIKIALETDQSADIRIAITDTGIGIHDEDIKKLFVQFSQVSHNSTRNMEGTGLGLAIALGLIKKMGGNIEVASELNKGSCFTVLLPNKRLSKLHTPTHVEPEARVVGLSLHDKSILVVDDIMMNCAVLESMLEAYGADRIISVNSGLESVEYVAQNSAPDLILMDMRMPGMDGIEATQTIRQQGYAGVIIAVTANATAEDEAACLSAGMNGFLAKPVVIEELEHVIGQLLPG